MFSAPVACGIFNLYYHKLNIGPASRSETLLPYLCRLRLWPSLFCSRVLTFPFPRTDTILPSQISSIQKQQSFGSHVLEQGIIPVLRALFPSSDILYWESSAVAPVSLL